MYSETNKKLIFYSVSLTVVSKKVCGKPMLYIRGTSDVEIYGIPCLSNDTLYDKSNWEVKLFGKLDWAIILYWVKILKK